jgi:hypothetical protein
MGFKNIMGTLSPAYGATTGEGVFGRMLNPDSAAKIAQEEQARDAAAAEQANIERQAQIAATAKANMGMKKGGTVKSASARADGIAQRGKTRGKMC